MSAKDGRQSNIEHRYLSHVGNYDSGGAAAAHVENLTANIAKLSDIAAFPRDYYALK